MLPPWNQNHRLLPPSSSSTLLVISPRELYAVYPHVSNLADCGPPEPKHLLLLLLLTPYDYATSEMEPSRNDTKDDLSHS